MNIGGFSRARALSRELFPRWSRHARARWVLAKMKTGFAKVAISKEWNYDVRAYWFQRSART